MKKSVYTWLVLLFCFIGIWPAFAQNDFNKHKMDSLARLLTISKSTKDSILILQQLVDNIPIRQSETAIYPDRIKPLLALDAHLKLIDPAPYQLILDGNSYWGKKQYHKALKSLQLAVDIFDKQHKSIVPLLMSMRLLYNLLDDQGARLLYYTQKLNYYLVNGHVENTGPCYHSIAYYYYIKGANNQSISYYMEGANAFRRYDPHYYANAIGVIGLNYVLWGNTKKAYEYLSYALPIAKKIRDIGTQSTAYYGLAEIANLQKDYKTALVMINNDLAVQQIVSQRTAGTLAFKADIYLSLQQPALALQVLEKVKAMADSGSYKTVSNFGDMELDYGYYRYYLMTGNIPKAETSLLGALKNATDEKGITLQLKYLRALGNFYLQQNKPQLSDKYFNQYFIVSDAREQSLDEFRIAQYEIDQNDKQQREHINQLKQEKAIQDYQLGRRNALLWSSLVVLFLISGLSIFIYRQLHINKKTLLSLRKTQRQLIQSEKMAPLGELTAGIAHEIQNPLNFVNNFSEVSTELIDELQTELKNGDTKEATAISEDIKQNLEKINHHGKRADGIVKGMLEHSRVSTGQKEPTDLNKLADEYMRLAYYGLRAKDKSFNAEVITSFDENLPLAKVIPQDIGRVFLNLFNNAFYAVHQKQKTTTADYKPTVEVSTFAPPSGGWGVTVRDNGNGIPEDIKDKILQPFFTTKPTGEGTGLGLSLSYDIVVKGHGGKIDIESTNEGAAFTITLPADNKP